MRIAIENLLELLQIPEAYAEILHVAIEMVALGVLVVVTHLVARLLIERVIGRLIKGTRFRWDDVLYESGIFRRLARLFPAVIVYLLLPPILQRPEWLAEGARRMVVAYIIAVITWAGLSAMDVLHNLYNLNDRSRRRPIGNIVQVAKLTLLAIGLLLVGTTLLDQSPLGVIGGIGAISAVLLLIFRDSILGFVAGVQLILNDLLHIGDWIEVPKYGADGEVVSITMQTIMVQNWDKTIVSIPVYALITDSFKNWRGMTESGGRRIKRALYIDMQSIQFCTPEMADRLKRFTLIRDHIEGKMEEIEHHNRERGIAPNDSLSGRCLTNIGIFRAYLKAYLQRHPRIHNSMTLMVRQLPPGPQGIPIEIYGFTNTMEWVEYEGIQSDIFDHLLAVVPEFGLRVYQSPTGADMRALAGRRESATI